MRNILKDKRNIVIGLLSALSLIRLSQEGLRFLLWISAGVILAIACDTPLKYLFTRQKIVSKSSVISGFIVSGILDYREPWGLLAVFIFLAIASKHAIKYKARHVFNPANFALFMAALFRLPLTWNIESNVYIIVIAGLYIAYSLKKISHIAGFLVFFTILFSVQGINPFMLISWFFIFVMLIEPKTSGYGVLRGFIFGSIAGISSFLVFKFFPMHDFFVSSLFIANLCNPLLEKLQQKKVFS